MTRIALRSASIVFCALTAGYALLCASGFTYHDFIRSDMFGVRRFALWHATMYWPWLALAVLDIQAGAPGRPASRTTTAAFAFSWGVVGTYVTVFPVLPALTDNARSFVVAIIALMPLLWLAAVDYATNGASLSQHVDARDAEQSEGRLLIATLGGALFLTVATAVLVPLLMFGQFEPDLLSTGLAIGLGWTLADVSVIFCGAFLLLAVVMRLTRDAPSERRYLILVLLATLGMSAAADRAVCQPLGIVGFWRLAIALALASAIVATWGALVLVRSVEISARIASPLDLFLGSARANASPMRVVAPLAGIVVAVYAVAIVSRRFDWDFLLLKSATAAVWIAAVAVLYRSAPARRIGAAALAAACVVPLSLWLLTSSVEGRWPDTRRMVNRYVVYNGSLRLAESLLHSAPGQVTPFQRYLRDATALANVDIRPVDLEFVSPLGRAPVDPAPNVFLFVIDSLRPDYLTPYNARATFTPRIAQFAAESTVFRNAMTRYGATGLSLPAIWSGAVGVHRQYVQPFAPMNTLEKLLIANRFERLMSTDVLMERLLTPWPATIELDRGRRTLDYDFCRTLGELEARFPAQTADSAPVFGYTNPQNLHLSNLMTASVPEGERYDGFHAPYAARVKAVDRCFGQFVDFLKARRVYDRSVIVLTSDHGELLGEEGRWGHAYYLFPQILQIPLIVHFPSEHMAASTREGGALDAGAISFSTDIAPTVYAALGYAPRPANRLMGEPLEGATKVDAVRRRRADYVVEASYSAVYGVVRKNGRRVYIIDAVSGAEYAYRRIGLDGWTAAPVDDAIRGPAQRIIREHVDEVRRVYRLPVAR